MSGAVEARLQKLGFELPAAAAPAANYVPFVTMGTGVFVSGQIPVTKDGIQFQGKVGADFSLEDGQEAARLCALNLLAQAKAAAGGDLSRIKRCVKLGGFVNCTPDFHDHPKVINGASDLIAEALGEAGPHARFAVGAPSLPFNVAVEIDAVFELSAS